jgi:hypothetical protein
VAFIILIFVKSMEYTRTLISKMVRLASLFLT